MEKQGSLARYWNISLLAIFFLTWSDRSRFNVHSGLWVDRVICIDRQREYANAVSILTSNRREGTAEKDRLSGDSDIVHHLYASFPRSVSRKTGAKDGIG